MRHVDDLVPAVGLLMNMLENKSIPHRERVKLRQ